MFDQLGERKVDLITLRDGFSLKSPAGRLRDRAFASLAEFETEVRAERLLPGPGITRARGHTPHVPWSGHHQLPS